MDYLLHVLNFIWVSICLIGCYHSDLVNIDDTDTVEHSSSADDTDSYEDTNDSENQIEDSESDAPAFLVLETIFGQWSLASIWYDNKPRFSDYAANVPSLIIAKDEQGKIYIDVISCYESKNAHCQLISETAIRCNEYIRHSIVWDDSPFPCTTDELTAEALLYMSMDAFTSYEIDDNKLVLFSDDGSFNATFIPSP